MSGGRRRHSRRRGDLVSERELLSRLIARFYASTGGDLPISNIADQYLDDLRSRRAKPHTVHQATRSLALLQRGLGVSIVGELSVARVHAWRARRVAGGASNRTANLDVSVLSSALALAVRLRVIDRHPLEDLAALPTTPRHRTSRARALSEDEIDRLLAAATKLDRKMPEHFPREPLLRGLLLTGARWSEFTRTLWADLDVEDGTLTLRAENTKTDETRVIPLEEDLLASMLELRAAHAIVRHRLPGPADRIFLTPLGTDWPAHTGNFLRWLHEVARVARVPKKDARGEVLHVHALRHTFVTRCVRAGIPDQVIAGLTGHKTLEMVKRYTHLNDDDKRRAIASLPRIVSTA